MQKQHQEKIANMMEQFSLLLTKKKEAIQALNRKNGVTSFPRISFKLVRYIHTEGLQTIWVMLVIVDQEIANRLFQSLHTICTAQHFYIDF